MDHPRHRSTRRVRLATAAVAGGALVGTGALTVVVAQAHPAAAEAAPTSTTSSSDTGTGTADQRPTRPGGFGSGGHGGSHASSGGS